MANTTVSPKVKAGGSTAAALTVLLWLADKWDFIASMPTPVHVAVYALIAGAVTTFAGWLATDPLRNLGAKFDNNPQTK